MTKLSDLQSILLSSAAAREEGSIYPVAGKRISSGQGRQRDGRDPAPCICERETSKATISMRFRPA